MKTLFCFLFHHCLFLELRELKVEISTDLMRIS